MCPVYIIANFKPFKNKLKNYVEILTEIIMSLLNLYLYIFLNMKYIVNKSERWNLVGLITIICLGIIVCL